MAADLTAGRRLYRSQNTKTGEIDAVGCRQQIQLSVVVVVDAISVREPRPRPKAFLDPTISIHVSTREERLLTFRGFI